MLLQPLVENAVRHGIAALVDGGVVRLQSSISDSRLQIVVQNSVAPAEVEAKQADTSEDGIGLRNVAQRLKMLYGDDHKFDLKWTNEGVCEVTIEIPTSRGSRFKV